MNRISFLLFCIISSLLIFCLKGLAKDSSKDNDLLIGVYYFDGCAGSNPVMDEKWAINAPTHLTKKWHVNTKADKPLEGGGMTI